MHLFIQQKKKSALVNEHFSNEQEKKWLEVNNRNQSITSLPFYLNKVMISITCHIHSKKYTIKGILFPFEIGGAFYSYMEIS